jgi:Tfp pilus assembly protein PilX
MNRRSVRQQRGAITLIGALFLIFAIIILLSSVQRMAASDINDTALQNDGVEALFLAETGLERAAWRYSTGSTCIALAGESDSAGRGSFLILSSALVGTLCRVRVGGSVVTTTAANTVRRAVEADFTQVSTTGDGWTVGKENGAVNIGHWDGSSWSPVPAPALPVADLEAVFIVTGGAGGIRLVQWTEVIQ